jgi:hypothetical protein
MSRKHYPLSPRLVIAAALAFGASGGALADGSSMARFGGDSYAYFNQPAGNVPASPGWRQSHSNGLTERELQALSSNDLSAFTAQVNPPVFARAPADPSWRLTHPNGPTDRELEAMSSSSLALWQAPDRSKVMANVAEDQSKETLVAQLKKFIDSGEGAQAGSN